MQKTVENILQHFLGIFPEKENVRAYYVKLDCNEFRKLFKNCGLVEKKFDPPFWKAFSFSTAIRKESAGIFTQLPWSGRG